MYQIIPHIGKSIQHKAWNILLQFCRLSINTNYSNHPLCFYSYCQNFICPRVSMRNGPVGWDRRIHRLHLCWGVKILECPDYGIKQSDGRAPVMLELWRMWSTPSLPSLPGPLRLGVVAPERALSVGQIELIDI